MCWQNPRRSTRFSLDRLSRFCLPSFTEFPPSDLEASRHRFRLGSIWVFFGIFLRFQIESNRVVTGFARVWVWNSFFFRITAFLKVGGSSSSATSSFHCRPTWKSQYFFFHFISFDSARFWRWLATFAGVLHAHFFFKWAPQKVTTQRFHCHSFSPAASLFFFFFCLFVFFFALSSHF